MKSTIGNINLHLRLILGEMLVKEHLLVIIIYIDLFSLTRLKLICYGCNILVPIPPHTQRVILFLLMTCQLPFCAVELKKQKLSETKAGLEDADTLV